MKYKIEVTTDSLKTLTHQKFSRSIINKNSRNVTFNEILCWGYITINYSAMLQEGKLLS